MSAPPQGAVRAAGSFVSLGIAMVLALASAAHGQDKGTGARTLPRTPPSDKLGRTEEI